MSEFEIRPLETDVDGPSFVNIYYKGVNLTPGQPIPAFGGEAEKMIPILERVVHLVHLKDSFRVGDRCRLKDVDLVNPDTGEVWVSRGAEGRVVKITWTTDEKVDHGCVLMVEVDFDTGKYKLINYPYVHSLNSNHLELV